MFYCISIWRDRFYCHTSFAGGQIGERDRLCALPQTCKGRICTPPTHQLHLKIKINQSSFWHCLTGQAIYSVYDMSFSPVGSLRHSCSASGVKPGMKHVSGLLSHIPDYLFIFRVSNKKMLRKKEKEKQKKKERKPMGRNQESPI